MDRYFIEIKESAAHLQPMWEEAVLELLNCFTKTKHTAKTAYFIGNGGSAGIAIHMAADFMKNGGMKTQTFYDPALITCMGNDYGFEHVFSEPLKKHAQAGDLLIAISSSGESANIINAARAAKEIGCYVITLTGFKDDNSLRQMGDFNVYVPIEHYGIVESLHNMLLQQVVDEIKQLGMQV